MSDHQSWSSRLEQDGFLERGEEGELHTTRRWHGALARAALRLYEAGDELFDLRTPIAAALIESYALSSDDEIAGAVHAMLAVTQRELRAPAVPPR